MSLRAARTHHDVEGADHVDTVLLGGLEGPHLPRVHGKGVLALHQDRLVLVTAAVPHHVVSVPLAQITKVDLISALRLRGHWRRNKRHWLRIRWQTGAGVATMGVVVPDPARWARGLSHLDESDTSR
jgi:hypothetical protein